MSGQEVVNLDRTVGWNSSVDQTENTIQNILLEELENFDGIFLATTYLRSLLYFLLQPYLFLIASFFRTRIYFSSLFTSHSIFLNSQPPMQFCIHLGG